MPRANKAAAEANRRAMTEAAGRLFREKGLDAVGVAEICRAAGLTHGALYSGFASKRDLALAALQEGRQASRARRARALPPKPDLKAILEDYVSARQRDNRRQCCPMVAAASEAGRQDEAYRAEYAELFEEVAASVRQALERQGVSEAPRKALAITAAMVGAVSVARALGGAEADALLDATRRTLAEWAG